MHVIIGIDCSTTGSKAVAFAEDGTGVAEARCPYGRSSPAPGWQEQNPDDWWTATHRALADLGAQLAARGAKPVALGITHQRETFACLDGSGAPLRPAIMWLDTRAGEQIARLGTPAVHEISGKPPSTTPSLYKLAWLAEHEPEALRRAATVIDVHGYLVLRLTGVRATSWACADPLTLIDMTTFDWSPRLLELAGLSAEQLPQLVAPGTVVGELSATAAAETGLPAGLPVVAGAGDGQCAGLGANVVSAGRAYLNLGTGLTLGAHHDSYVWSHAFRTLSSPIPGAYTVEALLSSGALSIAWFRDALSGLDPARGPREPRMEALAAQVPAGARGVLYLPYLTSAESPHWDSSARACFLGLSDQHGPAEMYRAVLEGLAYEEKLTLELMEQASGRRIDRIVAMGGSSRSAMFTQLLADTLERPVDVCAETETTALGAAILAAAAVGFAGEKDIRMVAERMSRVATTREPQEADRNRYRETYSVYRDVYPALRPLFPRLAGLRAAAETTLDGRDTLE
ncbi:xylulokinase [Amycolatopsis alkalitolerans]|uniref:xylulokinase n=1 Tax=Amycolatopsis alkalitolerans TaxID=2547244 RepID=UPI00190F220D|nr:FGGY family carbohydrate kinase [Amycolatopsis alkalitolerans]